MLLVASAVAPPTLAQTEGTPSAVAVFVFTAGGSFFFGPAEVVGVKIYDTMNKSLEHKVLSIELRPEKLSQWERMNEPNAGHDLSYRL